MKSQKVKVADQIESLSTMAMPDVFDKVKTTMNDAFKVTDTSLFMSKVTGKPVPIQALGEHPFQFMVPELDEDFVLEPELIKNIAVGIGENMPVFLYGMHGTGKSSVLKQFAAATNRPYLRIQHTGNTEESDLLGQTLAKDGGTYFEPGPLPLAMRLGWVLNLDEYDMPDPSILSVYQPVLEGEALYIKEAPPEWRNVVPHPDFRIVATGNTNGTGDETGLYQGTSMGNAANYSRFGICDKVNYLSQKDEIAVLMKKSKLKKEDAKSLVQFAKIIRSAFNDGKMTMTIGQRELINAAKSGVARVSWTTGIELAFINRLTQQDALTARQLMSTIFESAKTSGLKKTV